MSRIDEKKLHTREFQLKGSGGNMRCKLLQKRSPGKTTECSKHLRYIAIEKDILSELNRCIFQIILKYIKLVIPKILFILILCSFNFYFKITWPPLPTKLPPPTKIEIPDPSRAKTFLKFLPPRPRKLEGEGVHALLFLQNTCGCFYLRKKAFPEMYLLYRSKPMYFLVQVVHHIVDSKPFLLKKIANSLAVKQACTFLAVVASFGRKESYCKKATYAVFFVLILPLCCYMRFRRYPTFIFTNVL